MSIFEQILQVLFKQKFSKNNLEKLHASPRHQEKWIFSIFDYKHPQTKKLIRYLKNRNDFLLKKILAQYMSEYILDYLSDQQELSYFVHPIIISVPVSNKRLRERGFNQTHLLAKYFAKNIHGKYEKNIIKKHVTTKKQALIQNRSERFKNVSNVFSIRTQKKHLIKNQDFIIIDDLSTTGATLMEIKKVLKKYGARNVIAVTIAH